MTRNPDAVDAAEMQVREPIENLVADAECGIRIRDWIEAVGDILKRLGEGEISPARRQHGGVRVVPGIGNEERLPDKFKSSVH